LFSQGLAGRGLPTAFVFTVAFLGEVVTISPGFAVPEASTMSLVLPLDGGLNGAGPDDDEPALSQGFGGGPTAAQSKTIAYQTQFIIAIHDYNSHNLGKANRSAHKAR